jgi:hypothetical protein
MSRWRQGLACVFLALLTAWPSQGAQERPSLAVGASLFWAPWGYKFDRDRLNQNLQYLAARGVNYVRVLGAVGPAGWSDRTIDPRWPDYAEVIAGTTDVAYAHGLRVEWSIFGGVDLTPTPAAREAVVRRFAAMAKGREHKIQHFEVANEGAQNGFGGLAGRDEARALAALLRRETSNLIAITAPQDGCVDPATIRSIACTANALHWATWWYAGSDANLLTVHVDRNQRGRGGEWRPVQQVWEIQFLPGVPRAWTSNEPIGAQSSVAEDRDPLRATMSAALTWASGGSGYVVHSGAGIRGGGREDRQRARAANLWESPNMDAILAGIRTVRGLLPVDLPAWPRSDSSHDSANYPFDVGVLAPDLQSERVLAASCNQKNAEFLCFPIRLRGPVPFQARRAMHVDVHHPLTGAVLRAVDLAAGERLVLDGRVAAVVLKGQWRQAPVAGR